MKLGILGDLHLTSRGPSRRKDNYFETQKEKLKQAFSIFKENNCSIIFQPGDFFDSHTTANSVKAWIIQFLRNQKLDYPIFCVSGQHDISGHSLHTLKNSPLAVLQSAGVINILNQSPIFSDVLNDKKEPWPYPSGKHIKVYGASYGEDIPKPETGEGLYNILVIHKMIGDRELFPGQELYKPNQFLRNNPSYDLVICGDYHYRFSSQYQGRTIINSGCLVRKTISKWDLEHKPSVSIFDTETNEVKFVELDCSPVEEVFDLGRDQKIGKISSQKLIDALKNKIGSRKDSGKTAIDILSEVIKERKCSDDVRKEIDDVLDEIRIEEK